MWAKIVAWSRKHWLWILGAIALIIIGARFGWRLAALLGVGGTTRGAASALSEAQKRRKAEGQRLDAQRQDLEGRATETDQMIDTYYRNKGGPRS